MVGNIHPPGSNFAGLLHYNDRHKSTLVSKNMAGETAHELNREFEMCRKLNPRVQQPVQHHTISFAPQDHPKLTPDLLQGIVADYIEQMGYSNNQYVSYLHGDTDAMHLHLAINKVDLDGKNTHIAYSKRKSRSVLMDLEEKYDLVRTRSRTPENEKQNWYSKTYRETADRLHAAGKKTNKEIIKGAIESALAKHPRSEDEFAYHLMSQGVDMAKNKAGNGYNFALAGTDRKFKASTIHRSFSFAKLNEQFEKNRQNSEKRQSLSHQNQVRKEPVLDDQKEPTKPHTPSIPNIVPESDRPGQDQDQAEQQKKKKKRRKGPSL